MAEQRGAGTGRREFGRIVVASLADSARTQLEEHRARGRRLRARRAERRLAELERQLDLLDRGLPVLPTAWWARRGALAAIAGIWLATVGILVAAVAANGPSGVLVSVIDVVMLLATLLWFCVAIARRPRRSPPDEGSPHPHEQR
jgi:Flp pilus assembly protein TadB